jgi:hypothetical protein
MSHMKNKMGLIVCLFFSANAFSQSNSNSITMGNEFAMLAAHGGTGSNFSTFQSYSSSQVNGSQFFLPDWSRGEIALNDNEVFKNGIMLAYDKVRQEIFIKQQNAPDILLGTKEEIHSFSLKESGREYHFINSSVYLKVQPYVFYQVLVLDSAKLTLLKYTKGTFVKADKTDMMKQREGEVYDSFVDKVTYYVSKGNGELQLVSFKAKALKKTFSDLNINIDKYIDNHPESIDEDYLVNMVTELNN